MIDIYDYDQLLCEKRHFFYRSDEATGTFEEDSTVIDQVFNPQKKNRKEKQSRRFLIWIRIDLFNCY
jgi:hypothetical protein